MYRKFNSSKQVIMPVDHAAREIRVTRFSFSPSHLCAAKRALISASAAIARVKIDESSQASFADS